MSFTLFKSAIKGMEHIKIAFAGVGKPIKDSDWRISLLNFANRIAEKTTIEKAKIH